MPRRSWARRMWGTLTLCCAGRAPDGRGAVPSAGESFPPCDGENNRSSPASRVPRDGANEATRPKQQSRLVACRADAEILRVTANEDPEPPTHQAPGPTLWTAVTFICASAPIILTNLSLGTALGGRFARSPAQEATRRLPGVERRDSSRVAMLPRTDGAAVDPAKAPLDQNVNMSFEDCRDAGDATTCSTVLSGDILVSAEARSSASRYNISYRRIRDAALTALRDTGALSGPLVCAVVAALRRCRAFWDLETRCGLRGIQRVMIQCIPDRLLLPLQVVERDTFVVPVIGQTRVTLVPPAYALQGLYPYPIQHPPWSARWSPEKSARRCCNLDAFHLRGRRGCPGRCVLAALESDSAEPTSTE
ncbi:unnamed protein product [Pedinophyceae sp. YPF-701]|nr:unnamed protein product [Pedinophyceae sp. YPF-701]